MKSKKKLERKKRGGSSRAVPCSVSASEVEKILAETDWNEYWRRVQEACEPEIEAYRRAEARSRNSNHVFV